MYDEKEFKELEANAQKDHLFIDPQIVTAAPGFAAVACTVSNKTGKRVFRAAEGKNVSDVTECVMALALCAYYDKPIPEACKAKIKSTPAEEPAKDPSDGSIKQVSFTKNARAPQIEQQINTSAIGETDIADKTENATAPEGRTITDESAKAPIDGANSAKDAPSNFRVLIGNYEKRDDNYIEQMLQDDKGRKFLKNVMSVTEPSLKIKPYVEQTKAYLMYHNIQL